MYDYNLAVQELIISVTNYRSMIRLNKISYVNGLNMYGQHQPSRPQRTRSTTSLVSPRAPGTHNTLLPNTAHTKNTRELEPSDAPT